MRFGTGLRPWAPAIPMLLAACGGGGDSSSNAWLNLKPSSVDLATYEGDGPSFEITATSSKTVSGVINVGIVDDAGILDASATTIEDETQMVYRARFRLRKDLTVGTHTGALELRLCRDEPAVCAQPIEGSPWQLPYTVNVASSTHLTPLKPLPGAGPWTTFQGSARHTGYVAATIDAARFSRRFVYAPKDAITVSDAAVSDGLAVVVSRADASGWTLHGISEASGSASWTSKLGDPYRVNAPALSGGRVYVTSSDRDDSALWTFAAHDGTLSAKLAKQSQGSEYLAPTVADDAVYTENGLYGGLSRYTSDGTVQTWSTTRLPQYHGWTPAVEGDRAYALIEDRLHVLNTADGQKAFEIIDSHYEQDGYSVRAAAVLADDGIVYASQLLGRQHHLIRFDTRSRSRDWTKGTEVMSQPVPVGDSVYVLNGRRFQALSARTGEVLWSWKSDEDFTTGDSRVDGTNPAPLVVVGRYAFFSTTGGTRALDLVEKTVVWKDPAAGRLAVSANGVLYISRSDAVVAVNLH